MREDVLDAVNRIDEARLWDRHVQMARIGAIPGNGVNRPALSDDDIRARRLLISWAEARGFSIAVDPIGNLFVRREGSDPNAPPVLAGSHMDSQPRGGRFDGIYGVLAALEALEAIDAAGMKTRRAVEMVAWTNEEGGRFAPCTMGSMVFSGARKLDEFVGVTDNDGMRLGDALAKTLAATPDAAQHAFGRPVAAYVETHIEQGPRLEQEGRTIGIVTGIQGLRWFNVEVFGETAHAGTTPVSARKDALKEAVAIIAAIAELAHDETDVTRFTVGRMLVTPNSPNSVASHVLFSVDLRHPDPARIAQLGAAVEPLCRRVARACSVKVTPTLHDDPCTFDAGVVGAIERAAGELRLPALRLP